METKKAKKESQLIEVSGFGRRLGFQFRLALRLFRDRRVPFITKLLPLGALGYFLYPDLLPIILDDAAVVGFGTYLFMELCPPAVVAEHRQALLNEARGSTEIEGTLTDEE